MLNLGGARTITDPHVGWVLGYNVQLGRIVVGLQADGEYAGGSPIVISDIPGTPVRDEVRIEWTAHVLARAGYDIGGGWLPYLTGGLAIAEVDARHVGFITPTQTFTWHQTDTRLSYTLGGGIEKQFGDGRWSLRAEYIYDYWGAKHYDWVPDQRYSDIALRIDTFRFTMVRRF